MNGVLYTKSELKQRGWTEKLITTFLPVPDETKPNPHYRSGPPMKLYQLHRVAEVESSEAFIEAKESLSKHRYGAQKATSTKREKMKLYLDSVKVKVPRIGEERLTRLACNHYNSRGRSEFYASESSDPLFLERITVNFLRHELSCYERELAQIAGKVGAGDARLEIKVKVLEAITDEYPFLAEECSRQERRMWEETDLRTY